MKSQIAVIFLVLIPVSMIFTIGLQSHYAQAQVIKKIDIQKGSSVPSSKKSYNPKTATVDIDSTVRWINKDSTLHTVTSGKPKSDNTGEIFDSQYIASGDSFEFTFDKAGTYDYYCTLHPYMKGKIVVSEGTGIKTAEKQPPVKTEATINTNINVSTWSNFTDADERFSVQYPSHWAVTQAGNRFTEGLPLVATDVNGSTSTIQSQLSVNVFKRSNSFSNNNELAKFAINQLVKDVTGNKLVEPLSCNKYLIDGQKACSFVYSGNDKEGKRYGILAVVFIGPENNNHILSYRADPINFDQELQTMDHIITFYKSVK